MGKEITAMDNANDDINEFESDSEEENDLFVDNDKAQKSN